MSTSSPPRPPRFDEPSDPDALIEEARQRARRRRRRNGVVAALMAVLVGAGFVGFGGIDWGYYARGGAQSQRPLLGATSMPAFHHNGEIVIADYTGLVALDPTTGRMRRLASYCPGITTSECRPDFAWSPNGTELAYSVGEEVHSPTDAPYRVRAGVWVTHPATGRARKIESCHSRGCSFNLAWSPDGRQIAAASAGRIELINPTNGDRRTLVERPGAELSDPAWSPDGRRIAFVSDSAAGPRLYAITRGGDGLTVLDRLPRPHMPWPAVVRPGWNGPDADIRVRLASPVWAPNGSTITFLQVGACPSRCLSDYRAGNPGPVVRVVSVAPDGDRRRVLLSSRHLGKPPWGGCACHAWWPPSLTWAPDGTQLALISPAGLYLMDSDGSGFHRVASATGGKVAWQPRR